MSTPSIRSSVYNCTARVNGEYAANDWSQRNIFSVAAGAAHIPKQSNEGHAGRAAWYHTDNGVYGDTMYGFAGSDPSYHVNLFTSLRQVENMDDIARKLSFYDTLNGAARYETPVEFAAKSGATCPVAPSGGFTSYTNIPYQSGNIGVNSARKLYQAGLYAAKQPKKCSY